MSTTFRAVLVLFRFSYTKATTFMAIKYVTNADGKGWLVVRYTNGSLYPPLPQYLKVNVNKTENGREYFKILEGRNIDKTASVKLKGMNQSYFGIAVQTKSVSLKFDRNKKKLWYGLNSVADAKTDSHNPVPAGTYNIEIPYEVHTLAAHYSAHSVFATTWFRIGHSGDRFIHPGRISAGCITVTDFTKWTDIYNHLIKARKGDMKSVGTIEVI